jgi:GlpG protein
LRQIGTIPKGVDPRRLTDHLLARGISTRVDDRPDGTAIWVHDEDKVPSARAELDEYLKDPADPRYQASEQEARARRAEAEKRDREYRRNYRDLSGHWDRPNLQRRPLTTALIAISVAVFVLRKVMPQWHVYTWLSFTTIAIDEFGNLHPLGLRNILGGEVWRLITPIFLHFGYIHLLFDMWALWVLGSVIEIRRGRGTLALLVFVSAITSNLGQYGYDLVAVAGLTMFGGMSGVVYGLFGYLWMKGTFEPEQGMILHPNTVMTMLLWLVLCFTGAMGPIANAAHVVGLIAGVFLGLARL